MELNHVDNIDCMQSIMLNACTGVHVCRHTAVTVNRVVINDLRLPLSCSQLYKPRAVNEMLVRKSTQSQFGRRDTGVQSSVIDTIMIVIDSRFCREQRRSTKALHTNGMIHAYI